MQSESISAKAWILMDSKHHVYLRGFNTQEKRQIASLTKMYTLYACLTLNQMLAINPQNFYVQVFNANVAGTSANLKPFQLITILDLYYGLMLPSGNDAASILAFYYGGWLVTKKTFAGQPKSAKKESLGDRLKYNQLYTKKFVQFINIFIVKQTLQHSSTHFQNCHGLADKNQVSTAWQLAEASLKFISNATFSRICSCRAHRGKYCESDEAFQWQNTNILLHQGYRGFLCLIQEQRLGIPALQGDVCPASHLQARINMSNRGCWWLYWGAGTQSIGLEIPS